MSGPDPGDEPRDDVRGGSDSDVAAFLVRHPPFDDLGATAVRRLVAAGRRVTYAPGALVLDAFRDPSVEVFVVLSGRVALWNDLDGDHGIDGPPDEEVGPGGLFGFSAMLTERSVGPRAVAVEVTRLLRVPGPAAAPLFVSPGGARFLAQHISSGPRPTFSPRTYDTVADLVRTPPLVVTPQTPVGEVARLMSRAGTSYAAVLLDDPSPLLVAGSVSGAPRFGLVTDALLRRRVLAESLPPSTPASLVMDRDVPTAHLGDSAVEVMLSLLERDADVQLVVDDRGELRGAVAPRDVAVAPGAASATLPEEVRRATSTQQLQTLGARIPAMFSELLGHGLTSTRVVVVHSHVVDTMVRRALTLVLQAHPELDPDAFTWLSLGSNGRRESVLSSDVDSAVAFRRELGEEDRARYRSVFAEVDAVLAGAGLSEDSHGASARLPAFARSNAGWRTASQEWLTSPLDHNGAMMTSLLVDARPIHGDPGLPEVVRTFADLRSHPGTMRLLLQESLAQRARWHSVVDVLTRRADTFDLKTHALLPVVNLGRWVGLSVGSTALSTTERLTAAGGSAMLPEATATTLVEVFTVLQRLRLRYQLRQVDAGERPSDLLVLDRVSPIDRSVIERAVREVSAAQRRMSNVAAYVEPASWTSVGMSSD